MSVDLQSWLRLAALVGAMATLFSNAKLYRTTVDSLHQWNRLKGSGIQAGQRLTIFRPRTVATN